MIPRVAVHFELCLWHLSYFGIPLREGWEESTVGTCIAHGYWEAGQILGTEARSQSRPAGRGASAFKLGFVGPSILRLGCRKAGKNTIRYGKAGRNLRLWRRTPSVKQELGDTPKK